MTIWIKQQGFKYISIQI